MPTYLYEAMNKSGDTVKGELVSHDTAAAVEKLKEMGCIPFDIKEKKAKSGSSFFTLTSEQKITLSDLSLFSRQLSAMISAGIPVTRAIATLSKQTSNKTLAKVLAEISEDVEGGTTLTDAFAKYPKIFNNLYVSMIHAGELGGLLDVTLDRLSNQLHKDKKLQDDIKSATSYPKMIGIFALVVFIAMLVFLVPIFEGFTSDSAETPALTAVIFAVSRSIREYYYIWILALFVIIIAIYAYTKSKAGHELWEKIKLKLPIFGPIIQKTVIARFSRTLSTLVEGGIPIVQALQTAGPTSGSDLVARAVDDAVIKIQEGQSISAPLEASGLFPPMVTHMIAIGEEAGTVAQLLDKVAEFYEEDVETSTKQLSSVIEPVVLIVVGLVVAVMLISLYIPIFTSVVSSGG